MGDLKCSVEWISASPESDNGPQMAFEIHPVPLTPPSQHPTHALVYSNSHVESQSS